MGRGGQKGYSGHEIMHPWTDKADSELPEAKTHDDRYPKTDISHKTERFDELTVHIPPVFISCK